MKEIVLCGRGGQGAVTAAKILVTAAIEEGLYAHCLPSYGQERKGAPVFVYARISEMPVSLKSYVYHPDIIVAFDPYLKETTLELIKDARPGAQIVISTVSADEEYFAGGKVVKIGSIEANDIIMKSAVNMPPSSAMLGAFAATCGLVSMESIASAISENLPHEIAKENIRVAYEAYERTKIHENGGY